MDMLSILEMSGWWDDQSKPSLMRQAACAVDSKVREAELPNSIEAQKILDEFQTSGTELFTLLDLGFVCI